MLKPGRQFFSLISIWLATLAGILCFFLLGSLFNFTLLAIAGAAALAMLSSYLTFFFLYRSDPSRLQALRNGLLNILDDDFSISLAQTRADEIDELFHIYNRVTEKLRNERQHIYQRELLLDTVIQNASLALLLMDQYGRIVYSNVDAKNLLNARHPVIGLNLTQLLDHAPPTLYTLMANAQDGLFTLDKTENTEVDTYHISNGRFVLNAQEHRLILIKKMTRELKRQEIATWKKVIRVISHELNNSLAPISSMAHSGKIALEKERYNVIEQVLDTIAERSKHLTTFVGNYAQVAKLPEPQHQEVDWKNFTDQLAMFNTFNISGNLPEEPGYFDAVQLQQVLMNLLKNAQESGSATADIHLRIWHEHQHTKIEVSDRGAGMTAEVMSQALLPFYTTKKDGNGIGLSLCREIIELHNGSMVLENRAGGGLVVRLILPAQPRETLV